MWIGHVGRQLPDDFRQPQKVLLQRGQSPVPRRFCHVRSEHGPQPPGKAIHCGNPWQVSDLRPIRKQSFLLQHHQVQHVLHRIGEGRIIPRRLRRIQRPGQDIPGPHTELAEGLIDRRGDLRVQPKPLGDGQAGDKLANALQRRKPVHPCDRPARRGRVGAGHHPEPGGEGVQETVQKPGQGGHQCRVGGDPGFLAQLVNFKKAAHGRLKLRQGGHSAAILRTLPDGVAALLQRRIHFGLQVHIRTHTQPDPHQCQVLRQHDVEIRSRRGRSSGMLQGTPQGRAGGGGGASDRVTPRRQGTGGGGKGGIREGDLTIRRGRERSGTGGAEVQEQFVKAIDLRPARRQHRGVC